MNIVLYNNMHKLGTDQCLTTDKNKCLSDKMVTGGRGIDSSNT